MPGFWHQDDNHPDAPVRDIPQRPVSPEERARLAAQHRSWLTMIVVQSAVGAVIGVVIALAMINANIKGLGTMIAASPDGLAYTALFAFGFATLFGMVVSATAIWMRSVSGED